MTNEQLNKVKAEHTQKAIDYHVDQYIKTTERVLFYKHQLAALEGKSKLSEDEKKQKEEYKSNITNYSEAITELDVHIVILQRMMEAFENNTKIDL